jgi:hypothetical protein
MIFASLAADDNAILEVVLSVFLSLFAFCGTFFCHSRDCFENNFPMYFLFHFSFSSLCSSATALVVVVVVG